MNGLHFIHWDYNELEGNFATDSSIQMLSGAIKDNETNTTKGFYLRWALRTFVDNQLALSCIAEGKYFGDVCALTETSFVKIIQHSFEIFKRELNEKLHQTNITVSLDFDVSHEEASSTLQQLCEQ